MPAHRAVPGSRTASGFLVNGSPRVVSFADGRVLSVMSFTVHEGRITGLDILTDPTRPAALGLTA
ncbi:hypothetical protein ABZX88_20885 [Kitasatospora aureofaciens]|uniref:hypothetical protein n=1 Tax=Kitasatospora aureofaciens TaxID=1894 RepID=UPI0033BBAF31